MIVTVGVILLAMGLSPPLPNRCAWFEREESGRDGKSELIDYKASSGHFRRGRINRAGCALSEPSGMIGWAWVSTIAVGATACSRPSQSAPQSIMIRAFPCSISNALWRWCRRERTLSRPACQETSVRLLRSSIPLLAPNKVGLRTLRKQAQFGSNCGVANDKLDVAAAGLIAANQHHLLSA